MKLEAVEEALEPYGLKLRGTVALGDEELEGHGFNKGVLVVLVGNIGSSFWSNFMLSEEYRDGLADPLDRWSVRVANEVADKIKAVPLFPFQGPPYLPFQQWAKRAEDLQQSPIGLMMHPRFGLWHAYRFALAFEGELNAEEERLKPLSPCITCETQPCLNSCPVNAYTATGYDVESCAEYLNRTPSADCFQHGCMARYECPAGREYRYVDAQSRFHLQAFIGNRPGYI